MGASSRWAPLRNRNVGIQLLYATLTSFGSSLSQGSFLSNYMLLRGLRTTDVGFLFATSGLVNLALAFPLGYLTDQLSRQAMLRAGALFSLCAQTAFAAALELRSTPLLYAAAALNGVTAACTGPALAASFADSVPTGNRTFAFTLLYSGTLAAGGVGPAAAALFFHAQGNAWALPAVVTVMHAGNAVGGAAAGLLFFIRDAQALGGESEGVLAAAGAVKGGNAASDDGGVALEDALLPPASLAPPAQRLGLGHQRLRVCGATFTVGAVPYLLFSSDFIVAVGAGMTVGFFPLFFSQQEGLSPVALSLLFAAVPALVASVGLLLVPLAARCGRAPTALLANALGTACLFALWVSLKLPVDAVCALYLLRSGAMNGSAAVQRGLLMDVVPKELRGRWSAMEALTGFTWTGSALLGGWLIEGGGGYTGSFFYTALIYTFALLVFLPILPLTRGEKVDSGAGGEAGAARGGSEEGSAREDGADGDGAAATRQGGAEGGVESAHPINA
jgi:MFS family permease